MEGFREITPTMRMVYLDFDTNNSIFARKIMCDEYEGEIERTFLQSAK